MSTTRVFVGNIPIGAGSPITVQSMTNTDTKDTIKTIEQICRLQEAGCDIVRVAVPDQAAANAILRIKEKVSVPIVADIHFDYRLALICIENGADKVRINPGNIGGADRVKAVADTARRYGIPIRIGVNSGSLEKDILKKHGGPTAEALVESALGHAKMLEDCGFFDIVLSLKASDVKTMIDAYRLAAKKCPYPLHLGVTEAGTYESGVIKSAVGIGTLLAEGIGDTIRVSLTDDPVREVEAGIEILKALGLRKHGAVVVSCPTCGRCQVDMIPIAKEISRLVRGIGKDIKIAVMGCAVNGPGEAADADIGVACGKGEGLLFIKGKIVRKVKESEIICALMEELEKL